MVSPDPEDLKEEVYLHGSPHTTIDCLTKTFHSLYNFHIIKALNSTKVQPSAEFFWMQALDADSQHITLP